MTSAARYGHTVIFAMACLLGLAMGVAACDSGGQPVGFRLSVDVDGLSGIHESLLDSVPQEADLVVGMASLGATADSLAGLYVGDERKDAMVAEMQSYLQQLTGLSLTDLGPLVIWAERQSHGWGAVIQSGATGTLDGQETETLAGVSAVRLNESLYLARGDGTLLLGNRNGLEAMIDTSQERRAALAGSTGPVQALIRDRPGSSWLWVAVGATWMSDLTPMVGTLAGATLVLEGQHALIRIRLGNPGEAARLLAMVQGGLAQALGMIDAQSQQQMTEAFPMPLGAIAYRHAAHGIFDEQLDISTEGSDLLVSVTLPAMDSGTFLFMTGIASSIAIPAFLKYIKRAKSSEASASVRRLYNGAVLYYDTEIVGPTGEVLPRQFPASVPLTPPRVPCGDKVEPDPALWQHPTWQALQFSMDEPHYYSYQFDSNGVGPGATFTASAFGDLDCDGILSTFQMVGEVTAGGWVSEDAGQYVNDELE